MSVTRVASRYAKSLLDLAREQSKLDRVVDDITTVKNALKSRDLFLLLKSPIIKSDQKSKIFNRLFSDKLDPLTLSFFNQTIKKRREPLMTEVVSEFMDQYNTLHNITQVKLTVAEPLTDDVLQRVKAKLESSGVTTDKVRIDTKVNPSIIGGYIIEFGDKLFDASVAHQLDQIRKSFSN